MGTNIFDWLFPLRYSPCCNHDSGESAFALGPVVQRMREEAGLSVLHNGDGNHKQHRRRRKSRRHSTSRRGTREPVSADQVAEERADVSNGEFDREEKVVR